jgi:aryl carrier-like protein
MIPARVVVLPEFPHNASGKVDRRALAQYELAAAAHDGDAYDPPATPTQAWLAALWAELLDRHRVGISDDFFRAGGHSLLAMKILHRVREDRGAMIRLDEFLAAPTIAAMAAVIDELLPAEDFAELERQVDAMSDDEVETLLAQVTQRGPGAES